MSAASLIARLRMPQRSAARSPRTVRGLLSTLGRVVLWLVVGVVLMRGLTGILATDRAAQPRHVIRDALAMAWPDDAARAYAAEFTVAYLSRDPDQNPVAAAQALEAFAAPDLVGQLAPHYDDDRARLAVRSATVARVASVDDRHSLITVAATLAGAEVGRRLLTVPVARDTRGGVVVYDLPAFASAPVRASASTPAADPLFGAQRAAISDVLARFMRSYLAGDTSALAYLVPPGTRIAAAAGRWELLEVSSIGALDAGRRGGRLVLATVQARNPRLQATYALRYRVRLVRRDRWYVAAINDTKQG